MRERLALLAGALLFALSLAVGHASAMPDTAPAGAGLRPVSAFAAIRDPRARSIALFTEAG
ncbi:MAG TPA: Isoquinoline 1-oxidoreductase subunit, partial [Sphingomonas sp.]|nr:Isoquinoline 1-oxidoreductase subunit [Sphingomonas sp.]